MELVAHKNIQAEIEFLKGRQARKRVALGDFKRLVFGRDLAHGAQILINDETISKAHFALERRGRQVFLVDLESTNGTFLNGQEVSDAQIYHDEVITVGATEILFICPNLPNPAKTSNVLLTGDAAQRLSTVRADSAELIESLLDDRSFDRMGILDRAPEAFLEIGNLLALELDLHRLSRHVVKLIIDIFECDRAIILTADENQEGFKPVFGQTARGIPQKYPPDISKKTIQDSIESSQALRTIGEIFTRKGDVKERRIINMMVTPFAGPEKLRGAIYVDTTAKAPPHGEKPPDIFTKQHVQLLSAIANQVGMAIERARLIDEKSLSEEMYRLLVENANDWIFQLDSQGNFIFLNARTDKLLGRPRTAFLGKALLDVLGSPTPGGLSQNLVRTLKKGEAHTFEAEFTPPGSGKRLLSINLSPIENKPGDIVGALGVARDITLERQVQDQLAQSERLSSLGKLVSGMAHEMNNPLTSIIGFAQLLSMDPKSTEEVKGKAGLIFREGERVKDIVQNLLKFAQPQRSAKRSLDLNEVLRQVLSIDRYELERAAVEVIPIFHEDLPPVVGDSTQLIQVFLHLLNNARLAIEEARRPGTILIKTWTIVDTVHVSIADDGVGIKSSNINRIFDPFFTTREVGGGTGLGLSICYKLMRGHGGNITVNSTEDKGSTFEVIFPAAP
jgi:PAS domain S-box-containing protein